MAKRRLLRWQQYHACAPRHRSERADISLLNQPLWAPSRRVFVLPLGWDRTGDSTRNSRPASPEHLRARRRRAPSRRQSADLRRPLPRRQPFCCFAARRLARFRGGVDIEHRWRPEICLPRIHRRQFANSGNGTNFHLCFSSYRVLSAERGRNFNLPNLLLFDFRTVAQKSGLRTHGQGSRGQQGAANPGLRSTPSLSFSLDLGLVEQGKSLGQVHPGGNGHEAASHLARLAGECLYQQRPIFMWTSRLSVFQSVALTCVRTSRNHPPL